MCLTLDCIMVRRPRLLCGVLTSRPHRSQGTNAMILQGLVHKAPMP